MLLIYNNLRRQISDLLFQLHAITGSDTMPYKYNAAKVHVFKKSGKDPYSFNLIKI